MKKFSITFVILLLVGIFGLSASPQKEVPMEEVVIDSTIVGEDQLYGATAVAKLDTFTLEEMMQYALEDERMALAEYEMIMEKFNISRPFSNIIEAEKTHEGLLLELYKKYNIEVPVFDAEKHVVIPESIEETFEIGIDAEILNIEMYNRFLSFDLEPDVQSVFLQLRDGSIKHLDAFKKQAEKN